RTRGRPRPNAPPHRQAPPVIVRGRQDADTGPGWWRDQVKYQVSRVVAGPFLRLLGRPEMTGAEHIPRAGGAIVASNHLSIVDSVFLPFMLDRPMTFGAYRDLGPPAKARRAITDDVMKAIQALSGQEYVPMYASDRKAELNGGPGRRS